MKLSAVTIAAVAVFATTVAALPADMPALQALQERTPKHVRHKESAPKKPDPKKPVPHEAPGPKKHEPKKHAPYEKPAPNTSAHNKSWLKKGIPEPKAPASKPQSTLQDSCHSKKDGTFYTKWQIISKETLSNPGDYTGKKFVDSLRHQWQFGQIIKPCNPIDYQAIPTKGGAVFHFDTSNGCGGWQIGRAFTASRSDHLVLYCQDDLGQAISGDVDFAQKVVSDVVSDGTTIASVS